MKKSFYQKLVLFKGAATVLLVAILFVCSAGNVSGQTSLDPSAVPAYEQRITQYGNLQNDYLPNTGKYDYIQAEINRLQAYVNAINTSDMSLIAAYADGYLKFSESLLENFSPATLNQFQQRVAQMESQSDTSSRYYLKLKKVLQINSY